jgi:hypothetical protein
MKANETLTSERFQIAYSSDQLRGLTVDQKLQHFRDGIFDAIAQTTKEGTIGQPPMVERFHTAASIVDELLSKGMPFGVGPNSRMNKELRRLLNEQARQSSDDRKSRRKQIGEGATRQLLRKIRTMRLLSEHFVKSLKIPPYSE